MRTSFRVLQKRAAAILTGLLHNPKDEEWLETFEEIDREADEEKKKPKEDPAAPPAFAQKKEKPVKKPEKKPAPIKEDKPAKPPPQKKQWRDIYCGDDEVEAWCDPTWRHVNGMDTVNVRLHYIGGDEGDRFTREYPATEKGRPPVLAPDFGKEVFL